MCGIHTHAHTHTHTRPAVIHKNSSFYNLQTAIRSCCPRN